MLGSRRAVGISLLGFFIWLGAGCTASSGPPPEPQAAKRRTPAQFQRQLEEKVRHELAMLPYYGVFDHLAFRVDGDRVTLLGQVTRPTLKSDAENVVKRLEAVRAVDNRIEVLPPSPNDDRIRRATYRAIYSSIGLDRYGLGANPSIHIIVKGGHITLEGVVDNQTDKDVAYLRANGVSGARCEILRRQDFGASQLSRSGTST
jgi:hyperosmotically inducible protein